MRKYWKIKALIQGVISLMPGKNEINNFLQKHLTGRLALTPLRFETKVGQCRRHLQYAREAAGRPDSSFTVLELGTGWYPIVPIGMYLSGASAVWSVDIVRLMSVGRIQDTVERFLDYHRTGKLEQMLPGYRADRLPALEEGLASARSGALAEKALRTLNIEAMVCDARDLALGEGSVDVFVSNCVLEHIPPGVIAGILAKFRRLASQKAVMNHLIDMSDHYSDFDHAISPFNFLKYSDRAWRFYNNPLHYQNRLRLTDFRQLHEEAGFEVAAEHNTRGSAAEIEAVRPAKEFLRYPEEDLWIKQSRIISVARTTASRQ